MKKIIIIILISVFVLGCGNVKPKTSLKPGLGMTIEMDKTQPSKAPIILNVVIENISGKTVSDRFWDYHSFKGELEEPDEKVSKVHFYNHFHQEGSFLSMQIPPIKPKGKLKIPFMVSYGTIVSEHLFLTEGKYKLEITFKGEIYKAYGTTEFEVVGYQKLTENRMNELKAPPPSKKEFYNYVLRTTLTPEVRKKWYTQIRKPDLATKEDLNSFGIEMTPLELARLRVYRLSRIHYAIPDEVDAVMLDVLKIYMNKERNKYIDGMLNNAVYVIAESIPPNAGKILLDLATSNCRTHERQPAIQALRFYYKDEMKERLMPLLKEESKWVPVITARLLAWAGYDDGLDILIESANNSDSTSAAYLRYFPDNKKASETLKKALKSDDKMFLEHLKLHLDKLSPQRK